MHAEHGSGSVCVWFWNVYHHHPPRDQTQPGAVKLLLPRQEEDLLWKRYCFSKPILLARNLYLLLHNSSFRLILFRLLLRAVAAAADAIAAPWQKNECRAFWGETRLLCKLSFILISFFDFEHWNGNVETPTTANVTAKMLGTECIMSVPVRLHSTQLHRLKCLAIYTDL